MKAKLHLVLKILRSVFGLNLHQKKQGNRIHTLLLSDVRSCKKKKKSYIYFSDLNECPDFQGFWALTVL